MNTETLIVGGFVLLVIVGLVANARNKRRYHQKEMMTRLREAGATGTEMERINIQLQQANAAKKSAGRTGCIMWLLLGLVFGPFLCVILAGLLGLWPILFAGVQ